MTIPSRRERVAMAIACGVAFFALTLAWLLASDPRRAAGDFSYPWLAARALLNGREPYAAVRAAGPFGSPFFYPLPAALIAMPFAWLPAQLAGASFMGVGFGWLAYQLSAAGRWRLLVLTAAPALFAVLAVQWSPFLTAAALSGPALALVVAKPTIGLALAAAVIPGDARPGRRLGAAAIGVAVLVALSFAARPDWLGHWLSGLRQDANAAQYRAPIVTPYGLPVVLALLRWRRPEARLIVVLACVRQNGFLYDQLPLLLVPGSVREALVLSALSHASHVIALWHPPADGSILALSAQQYPFTIVAMYVPCLWMVLRRPNEGRMPAWVERVTASWPPWLRGRGGPAAAATPALQR